jgi:plasmid maintenance system antidote protein VapI
MTFQEGQQRLLAYVRTRIQNGELTERGLARLLGISQPHIHNVLNGSRKLSAASCDSMLRYFQISVLDLADARDVQKRRRRNR